MDSLRAKARVLSESIYVSLGQLDCDHIYFVRRSAMEQTMLQAALAAIVTTLQ